MGWIRSVDRQALHRPHGSLAVHLKYKKKTKDFRGGKQLHESIDQFFLSPCLTAGLQSEIDKVFLEQDFIRD